MSWCKKKEKEKCCNINRDLVSYKLHYFLLSGAHVGVVPYLPIYAKTTLGCSATTIGILATCMQFSTTISKPLFGLLADCLNQMKVLIALLLSTEVLLNLLMLALSPVAISSPANHMNVSTVGADIFLRFSPARLYDASVGHHKQAKFRTDLFSRPNYSSKDRTSKHEHVSIWSVFLMEIMQRFSRNFNGNNAKFSKDPTTFPRHILRENQNQKCKLNCESFIIDATCSSNESICLRNGTANLLTCFLAHRTLIPFCKEFRRSSNFTITFEIKSFQRSENEYNLIPHSLIYYRKFHRGTENFCNITSTDCNLTCEEPIPHCAESPENETPNLYTTYQFWLFCIFALLGAMCQGALYTLSDTVCYERLRGTTANFGRQRLWGAVGWGTMAFVTGYINDLATGPSSHENYTPGWYVMAVLSFCFLLNLYVMKIPKTKTPDNICRDFKSVIFNRQFVLMEINVFFAGMLTAYTSNYVMWYMESLGSNSMQMGLALAVACVLGEGPFMYFSEWLISKLGHWNIVTLSFIAFATRFGAYYMIVDPWLFLPIEILDGVTFGLFYTTVTSFGELISTPGTEATVQGILGGTYQGLGSSVGCLVAGLSFDAFGGRYSFLLVSVVGAVLALSHSVLYLICKPRKTENSFESLKA